MTERPAGSDERRRRRRGVPLHQTIYKALHAEITGSLYRVGDRLPSEAALCQRFGASRITVAKAIGSLQREGLVRRRAGSGTFVESPVATGSLKFGLLIPELGSTAIFEPICKGMMSTRISKAHTLVWGNAAAAESDNEAEALALCHQFIAQRVDGIFFAPLEYSIRRDATNEKIITAIEASGIPIVLLDRGYKVYPERSIHDFVGIDNQRAGFVLTRHLQRVGRQRILFATRCAPPSTVQARIAGYRLALLEAGDGSSGIVVEGDFSHPGTAAAALEAHRPDAFVCANDITAAHLMRSLLSLGVTIPTEVAIVGVDNVHYAGLLPVPLTTIEQNCPEIGAAAMSLMLGRIENRDLPGRDLLVDFRLIVRESCGQGRTAARLS